MLNFSARYQHLKKYEIRRVVLLKLSQDKNEIR